MSSPTTPEPRALDVEGLRELERSANEPGKEGTDAFIEFTKALVEDAPALLDAAEERDEARSLLEIERRCLRVDPEQLNDAARETVKSLEACYVASVADLEAERAAHARTREALRDAKGLLFSPKSLRALSDFVLRHGDLDSNAVCLTSLDLRKRAEATEQFRAAQALLEGEGDGQ